MFSTYIPTYRRKRITITFDLPRSVVIGEDSRDQNCPLLEERKDDTHLKFNSEFTPEKFPGPKRKVIFRPSFFRGYVKLPGGTWKTECLKIPFRKVHLMSM